MGQANQADQASQAGQASQASQTDRVNQVSQANQMKGVSQVVSQVDGERRPVAIIGYGTAGVNALIALRNAGYEGAVRVFSDGDTLPYSPILTSYYAGGEKAYDECFPWSEAELDALNADVMRDCPVVELDPVAHVIHTEKGEFEYAKCVIATGATPMCWGFPEVEGDEGYAPLVLRSMDDAERLKVAIEDPRCSRVLVSGASMVALKALEACLNRGLQVTLVGMNPHVLDFNALPEAAERFEKGLREKGVQLRLGQTIAAVKRVPDDLAETGGMPSAPATPDVPAAPAASSAPATTQQRGKLEVTFSNGEADAFDEIFVAHGMKSNLDFVKEGSLKIDRALVVDEFMRTSDPDVYAAGDVAQALELISGEKRVVGIWKNATLQGECAGRAIAAEMAGRVPSASHAFKGSLASNTIAVSGTLFISAGTMELSPDRWVETRETDDMTVVYVFERDEGDARRLVGFNLVCDKDEEGSVAYDTGAMLTMRIERGCAERGVVEGHSSESHTV